MKSYINALVNYGTDNKLIDSRDRFFAYNRILEIMRLDSAEGDSCKTAELSEILAFLTGDAVRRGIIGDDTVSADLFDTKLMSAITPFPHEVISRFYSLYNQSPVDATDWYYSFSKATNYIRTDRIKKDEKWTFDSPFGTLDITINLSKPEKDPRAIAAAKLAPQSGYPACLLCAENEGYAGRVNHPARQNHRIIPLKIAGADWYLQYSPYVYYNEHCIVFNSQHIPMQINENTFRKLLDFVAQFPHYILGSNADLPIVGGSILSHDHFQGGRYEFAMAKADVEREISFKGFEDIGAGILKWPMSVIRLSSPDAERLISLAGKILSAWRSYTDESAFIFSETDGVPHNTITPIARKRGDNFELDLVLRNNIITDEHPLGVYHPHEKLHHIKKENIGLIEVMGLAILPARLKTELSLLKTVLVEKRDISAYPELEKHAEWAHGLENKYYFTEENAEEILKKEIGRVFMEVLLDAGVYKTDEAGRAAFMRFIETV